jgi:hypothetical protein
MGGVVCSACCPPNMTDTDAPCKMHSSAVPTTHPQVQKPHGKTKMVSCNEDCTTNTPAAAMSPTANANASNNAGTDVSMAMLALQTDARQLKRNKLKRNKKKLGTKGNKKKGSTRCIIVIYFINSFTYL